MEREGRGERGGEVREREACEGEGGVKEENTNYNQTYREY